MAIISLLLPFDRIHDADVAAQSPFTLVLEQAGLPGAVGVMEVVIVVALLSSFNAQIYATSRLVFDMAHEGNAHKLFLKTSRTGSPPVNAVILSMIFAFASVGLQYWNPPGLLAFLFNAVGGCLLVIWLFITCSYLKLHPQLKANGEITALRAPGFPYVPWLVMLAMAALIVLMVFDPSARGGQVIAVLVLSAALIVLAVVLPVGKREKLVRTPSTAAPGQV